MKKTLSLVFAILSSVLLLAQEAEEKVYTRGEGWSDDTKWTLVGIFVVILLILVLRTFRNKPTV